ncbi:MAG: hypothetical protein NZ959_12505 [Armatimonadetes bacterium]|nr:hypothetical protein [Armatimonadota bacterium]MDW8123129.1 hypothetical protein [Armatimonadota bacterium]
MRGTVTALASQRRLFFGSPCLSPSGGLPGPTLCPKRVARLGSCASLGRQGAQTGGEACRGCPCFLSQFSSRWVGN